MKELKLKAMAKINLGLDVLRKREDGYHDLRMIMQSIYLYDQIRIRQTQKPGIRLSVNLGYLPAGPENLVYKAADLLMKEFGIAQGVAIDLQKYIPVAAGLAGGSSDAAAVLIGVNRLFHLGLTLEELQERGVKLGARQQVFHPDDQQDGVSASIPEDLSLLELTQPDDDWGDPVESPPEA